MVGSNFDFDVKINFLIKKLSSLSEYIEFGQLIYK